MRRALLDARRDERGVAMVLVVFAMVILSVLGVALLELVTNETKRSGASVKSQTSFQAAEAGIDDYLAKLVDNRVYYLQYVHPAESTRRDTPSGTTVGVTGSCTTSSKPSPVQWSLSREWTSPNGKDRWCQLPGGFEYNLQVTAPQTPTNLTDSIRIVSTGHKTGSTTDVRSIEVLVDPTSVADYQMLSASSVTYGNDATTTGKIYSANDICHQGVAQANIYAEDDITCSPSYQLGAVGFNSTNIPTPPSGTNFAALQVALIDVERAATTGGINLDDFDNTNYHGWRITFQSSGSFLVESCRRNASNADLADQTPVCGGSGSYSDTKTIPANGAVYASKTIIISGPGASGINGPSTVNGRVTVASNDDIVIAGNINYVNAVACNCGDDVLGMIALNSVYVADWAPNQLTWRGASLAESYQWRAWDCGSFSPRTGANPDSVMTYYGSTITNGTVGNPDRSGSTGGGCMSSYDQRFYNYDPSLLYLPPPWFPTIDTPYTILLFREIPATL
jgi:hypothetical protein